MAEKELFGNSEQLDDTISRQGAINAIKDALLSWSNMPGWRDNKIVGALDKLPSAQQIPWDKNTRNSMMNTLQRLCRLAYNTHGVMDAIDDDNVMRLREWLKGGEP